MTPRHSLTIWVPTADHDDIVGVQEHYEGASRHIVLLAAARLGLRLLKERPELLLDAVQDQARAKRLRRK